MSKTDHLRLLLDNVHDRASLTATSSAPGTPIENTQRNERARVHRTVGLGTLVVEGVLDTVAFIDNLYVLRHNLSGQGVVRLELMLAGEVVADSGEQPTGIYIPAGLWRAGIDPFGATYNDKLNDPLVAISVPITPADSYRITITDPTNTAGALELGRIVLGLVFAPEFNASYDLQIERVDPATHEYSAGQTLRTINGGNTRKRTQFDLSWLGTSDRARLIEELGQHGMITDVFVDLYPAGQGVERLNGAFLGRMESGYGDSHTFYNNRKSTVAFIEV